MNILFVIVFAITFLLSQSELYPLAIIGIVALFLITPKTTPEKIGQKKIR